MKVYNTVALSVLLAVFSTAVLAAPTNNNGVNPFVELNGELITVQGAITSLQDQIDMLVGRVNSIIMRL